MPDPRPAHYIDPVEWQRAVAQSTNPPATHFVGIVPSESGGYVPVTPTAYPMPQVTISAPALTTHCPGTWFRANGSLSCTHCRRSIDLGSLTKTQIPLLMALLQGVSHFALPPSPLP